MSILPGASFICEGLIDDNLNTRVTISVLAAQHTDSIQLSYFKLNKIKILRA